MRYITHPFCGTASAVAVRLARSAWLGLLLLIGLLCGAAHAQTYQQVSAGNVHTCAVLVSGGVQCWGEGGSGQLGNGSSTTNQPTPVAVTGISNALGVSVGASHSCAVLASGGVQCWGFGGSGRLGNGSTANQTTPVAVTGITNVTAVSAGDSHTCAVLASGGVQCWGFGFNGQLGNGGTGNQTTPVAVTGITTALAVSAGSFHTCAVLASGGMQCWGSSGAGQLGNGGTVDQPAPVAVTGISNAIAVSAGGSHTCAVLASGGVQCWGFGGNGRLGNGSTVNQTTPVAVAGITNAIAVSAGGSHSCAAVPANGGVLCWGLGNSGQLGSGSTGEQWTPWPVNGTGIINALAVSAGARHTCAVLTTGRVRCWGSGQLGDGLASNAQLTPVAVYGITSATRISAGDSHTCVVVTGSALRCWGSNRSGQLGDDTGSINRLTPQYIASIRCDVDLDGNGSYSTATDGLLYTRALSGLSGNAVTSGALGAGATRTTWQQIRDYLKQVCKVNGLAP